MSLQSRAVSVGVLLTSGALCLAFSRAAEPPKEQPPPGKKTTAELLVAKWRVTKEDDTVYPSEGPYPAIEFTADGKFTAQVIGGKRPSSPQKGTYQLEGKMIHLSAEATSDSPARSWTLNIEAITEDKMVTTTKKKDGGGNARAELERMVEKKEKK